MFFIRSKAKYHQRHTAVPVKKDTDRFSNNNKKSLYITTGTMTAICVQYFLKGFRGGIFLSINRRQEGAEEGTGLGGRSTVSGFSCCGYSSGGCLPAACGQEGWRGRDNESLRRCRGHPANLITRRQCWSHRGKYSPGCRYLRFALKEPCDFAPHNLPPQMQFPLVGPGTADLCAHALTKKKSSGLAPQDLSLFTTFHWHFYHTLALYCASRAAHCSASRLCMTGKSIRGFYEAFRRNGHLVFPVREVKGDIHRGAVKRQHVREKRKTTGRPADSTRTFFFSFYLPFLSGSLASPSWLLALRDCVTGDRSHPIAPLRRF